MPLDGRAVVWSASAFLFLSLMVLFWGNPVPVIPDEIGYLSIARYLASGEAMNLEGWSTYKIGQGLLLYPGWAVFGSAGPAYVFGVAVSSAATALIPMVLLAIARQLGIKVDGWIVAASFLVTIFPTYFYQNSVVWPETVLRLAYLLAVWLAASAWQSGSLVRWVLLAVTVCGMYALHNRALLAVPLFWLFMFWGVRRGTLNLVNGMIVFAFTMLFLFGTTQAGQHVVDVIWNGGDPNPFVTQLLAMAKDDGPYRILSAVAGQIWSQLTASFGLYILGLVMAARSLAGRSAAPAVLFAVGLSLATFAASVGQMLAFSRIDHLIYARYNDAASTFFVWLGLVFVLTQARKNLPLALTGVAVVLSAGAVLAFATSYQLADVVAPNIPALIWTAVVGPLQTADVNRLVVLGSIAALAILATFAWPQPRVAFAVLTLAVLFMNYWIVLSARATHSDTARFLEGSRLVYQLAEGVPISRDRSAAADAYAVMEQYGVIGKRTPWSNIAAEDIEQGEATVVGSTFSKVGYACLGRLPSGSKLLKRAPGPDEC